MMASNAGVRVWENTLLVGCACERNNLPICTFKYYEVCDDVVVHVGM
jgi:hypothetical protein